MLKCDLNSGLGQLQWAFSQLKDRWAETKTHWRDDACRAFEESHLQQLPPRLQLFAAATQRLAEVIQRAERECDDRE
jgi:hypothetical protein